MPNKVIVKPWSVVTIVGNEVTKVYTLAYWKTGYEEVYDREVRMHQLFEGCPWKPYLKGHNKRARRLVMTYCGEHIAVLPADWREQVSVIDKFLKSKKCYLGSVHMSNVLLFGGRIYLIDLANIRKLSKHDRGPGIGAKLLFSYLERMGRLKEELVDG